MRKGYRRRRPAGRSKNIWPCSTIPPSVLPRMWCPSSSHRPIRRRDGPARHGEQAFFAYSTSYLIDVDHGIIDDVEATTAIRQAEILAHLRSREHPL